MAGIPKQIKFLAKYFPPIRKKIKETVYFEIKRGFRPKVSEAEKGDFDFKDLVSNKNFVLYFHFPFCKSACKYCTFRTNFNKKLIDEYCETVIEEIQWIAQSCNFQNLINETVYFGGGTPSLIPKKYLEEIIFNIKKYLSNGNISQISMEGSPHNMDGSKENLKYYKEMGINRLSIGVQSFQSQVLAEMKRIHNNTHSFSIIEKLNHEDFDFNIDLLYGFDCQDVRMFVDDVQKAITLSVPHISLYPLARAGKKGAHIRDKAMEIKQRAQYNQARNILLENGYKQYTTDNFYNRESAISKYLAGTWKGPLKDTLTIGASGFGWANDFYSKPFNVKKYIECVKNKIKPILIMNLTEEQKFYGRSFFSMHGIEVNRQDFIKKHGRDIAACELIKVFQAIKMLTIDEKKVCLNEDKYYDFTELWGRATFLELMDEQEISQQPPE